MDWLDKICAWTFELQGFGLILWHVFMIGILLYLIVGFISLISIADLINGWVESFLYVFTYCLIPVITMLIVLVIGYYINL